MQIGDVGLARLHTDGTGADVAWTLSCEWTAKLPDMLRQLHLTDVPLSPALTGYCALETGSNSTCTEEGGRVPHLPATSDPLLVIELVNMIAQSDAWASGYVRVAHV